MAVVYADPIETTSEAPQGCLDTSTVPFQDGPFGFVRYGIEEPIPFLFLRVTGGRGAGKTEGGGKRSLYYMHQFPGSVGMVVAEVHDKIRDTILPMYHRVFAKLGQKPNVHYSYNKTEKILTHISGSIVYMRSADEPDRLAGPNLDWFWLDEYRKHPFEVWKQLAPALRPEGKGPPQAWCTSTPIGRKHWTRKLWYPKQYQLEFPNEQVPERKAGRYLDYKAFTRDNPNLPEGYWETMISIYGEDTPLARQELYGEELVVEGLIFPAWDTTFIVPREEWPIQYPKHVIGAIDFGFSAPSAILIEGYQDGMRFLMDEFYQPRMSEVDLALVAKAMMHKHNVEVFICDSSDPRWIRALNNASIPAIPVRRSLGSILDPSSGLGLCGMVLNQSKSNGEQTFYVAPHLTNYCREMENYVQDDDGSPLRKQQDHLLASWRYNETYISQYLIGGTSLQYSVNPLRIKYQ